MIESEFGEWLKRHCNAFPGLNQWLASAGADTIDAWRRALSTVRLSDACDATDGMLRDGPPEGFTRHPSEIFQRCAKARRADNTEQDWRRTAVRCRECLDTGFISVWHPDAVDAYRQGVLDLTGRQPKIIAGSSIQPRTIRWASARCGCKPEGESSRVPLFDERRYVRCISNSGRIEPNDVHHFVEVVGKSENAWRVAEFDDFNGGGE